MSEHTIDDVVVAFSKALTSAGADHIRTVSTCRNNKGDNGAGGRWYDRECRDQRAIFKEREKAYRGMGNEENRHHMIIERNKFRQLCRNKKKGWDRENANSLKELARKDPKSFWKAIKRGGKREDPPDCDLSGHFKTLAQEVSNISEEGQREIEDSESMATNNENMIEELDAPIEYQELSEAIKQLKGDKAAGIDLILNEFLTHAPVHVKKFILVLFNNIMDLRCFPRSWSSGWITPIHKKGDKDRPK